MGTIDGKNLVLFMTRPILLPGQFFVIRGDDHRGICKKKVKVFVAGIVSGLTKGGNYDGKKGGTAKGRKLIFIRKRG